VKLYLHSSALGRPYLVVDLKGWEVTRDLLAGVLDDFHEVYGNFSIGFWYFS